MMISGCPHCDCTQHLYLACASDDVLLTTSSASAHCHDPGRVLSAIDSEHHSVFLPLVCAIGSTAHLASYNSVNVRVSIVSNLQQDYLLYIICSRFL